MVIKPEPVFECVERIERDHGQFHKILLTPKGVPLRQKRAIELSGIENLLLLCGRYEGFDERIREGLEWEEISLGDFVLCGGEIAALAVVEATVRLIPGVLGDESSPTEESFSPQADGETPGGLEYPHYTRPREYRGMMVPEVLLSGDHRAIRAWRRNEARQRTEYSRPDLLEPDASGGNAKSAPLEREQ